MLPGLYSIYTVNLAVLQCKRDCVYCIERGFFGYLILRFLLLKKGIKKMKKIVDKGVYSVIV